VAEVHGVLKDPPHLLLFEEPVTAPFLPTLALGGIADAVGMKSLKHSSDGAQLLHGVVDVLADDLRFLRMRGQFL
jgi:hypothetical protein